MIYPNTATLEPEQLSVLLEEYRKHNFIDPEVSEKLGVKRGLRNPDGTGVLAGLTSICDVQGYITNTDGSITPSKGHLIYRGYDIDDFAKEAVETDTFMFEKVIWLLLLGNLPTEKELEMFQEILESHRELPDGFAEKMIMSVPSPNIMNQMARSVLSMYAYDPDPENTSLENIVRQSINS